MATVVGLFDSIAQAQQAVQQLVASGVRHDDISLIAHTTPDDSGAMTDGGRSLVLPGIGPLQLSGPLAAALGDVDSSGAAGTLADGLLGALMDADVSEDQAHVYVEGVRRHGTLVAVQGDNTLVSAAFTILHHYGAANVDDLGAQWRQTGWERFDPDGEPYAAEQHEGDLVADDEPNPASHSASASVGALSGGVVPGAYGAAGDVIFGTDEEEHRPDWERD